MLHAVDHEPPAGRCAAAPTASSPATGPAPMPETAAACRALLRTVGLEQRWLDTGPDEQAQAWLDQGDRREDRPAELDADQWTMLRVCGGIWTGKGLVGELLVLRRSAAYRAGGFLQAWALSDGACSAWASCC